jgi:hypothetical protein
MVNETPAVSKKKKKTRALHLSQNASLKNLRVVVNFKKT